MEKTRSCQHGKRGKDTKEFVIKGKPKVLCHGWTDKRTDEVARECKTCQEFVFSCGFGIYANGGI